MVREPVARRVRVGTRPVPMSVRGADALDWDALARCESGGLPDATDPSGTYGGLYQFDTPPGAASAAPADPRTRPRPSRRTARSGSTSAAGPPPGRTAGTGCAGEGAGGDRGVPARPVPLSRDQPHPDALLGPADVRELAAALGVRPTKQRGQNFVIDANTVRRIVRTAEVRPDDVVVEVGPGLGSLTLALLEAADRVTAVEIDDVLAGALPATVAARMPERADRFALVHSDAMHVTELPGPAPPRWSPTSPTTSPSRCCCTCSRPSRASSARW